MRTIEGLTYDAYERHILVFHGTGGGRFAAYSKSPALWVERTQDGRYHLCDANRWSRRRTWTPSSRIGRRALPSLTITQAATALGVDANTLRQRAKRLRARGKTLGRKVGSAWVYTSRDLARLQAAGRGTK